LDLLPSGGAPGPCSLSPKRPKEALRLLLLREKITVMSSIQVLDSALFQSLIERARQAPRLRVNHNFHASMEENPHRFLNVMIQGTYITPHRHLDPPKAESFLVLLGKMAFFTFDDTGRVLTAHVIGSDLVGIDIQPGVWHTMTPLTPEAVCYEVKPGPYSATNDKDFAPWAPREGDPGVAAYTDFLLSHLQPGK